MFQKNWAEAHAAFRERVQKIEKVAIITGEDVDGEGEPESGVNAKGEGGDTRGSRGKSREDEPRTGETPVLEPSLDGSYDFDE